MKIFSKPIIVSGPIIIENNKVLLVREQKPDKISLWMFPGGGMEDTDTTPEDACRREVMEEMGIKINIIKPLKTLTIEKNNQTVKLYHYLSERIGDIRAGKDIVDWNWHDIKNLPDNCAPNVYEIIKSL